MPNPNGTLFRYRFIITPWDRLNISHFPFMCDSSIKDKEVATVIECCAILPSKAKDGADSGIFHDIADFYAVRMA